jgi:hypothetical protein
VSGWFTCIPHRTEAQPPVAWVVNPAFARPITLRHLLKHISGGNSAIVRGKHKRSMSGLLCQGRSSAA